MANYWYAFISYIRFWLIKALKARSFRFTKANLIFPLCVFDFSSDAVVSFGYKMAMRRNTQVTVRGGGNLAIGNNSFFNANCVITCHQKITIGNDCKFGPGCMLFDHDHNMKNQGTIVEKGNFTSDRITIGDGCWFGAGCIILKGTEIPPHCVFGAGTIIKGTYEPGSVVIQKRNTTIRKLESQQTSE